MGLAATFLFLSIDEMLGFHERLIEPTRSVLNASGLLFYAWVVPYAVGVVVFLAVYLRFLFRLPRRTAVLFVIAGAIFVGGAIGMEMLGGLCFEVSGSKNLLYVGLQTIEEILEMAGIVVFMYAIADWMVTRFGGVEIALTPAS